MMQDEMTKKTYVAAFEGAKTENGGSPLSQGDTIEFSPLTALRFHETEDTLIKGLPDPTYDLVPA
ncbi:hypothetical protein D2917_03970 [Cupriavidus oxalaticus]|uniref:Uncharacterized protein n=2 Tax=Cupriavidus oxalaticus TaxID=96344 RepID=A0A5P3VFR0_9BURK|nr:hypothetical protein D2917_03970 [Cupriavidus oxalaticus]